MKGKKKIRKLHNTSSCKEQQQRNERLSKKCSSYPTYVDFAALEPVQEVVNTLPFLFSLAASTPPAPMLWRIRITRRLWSLPAKTRITLMRVLPSTKIKSISCKVSSWSHIWHNIKITKGEKFVKIVYILSPFNMRIFFFQNSNFANFC